MQKFIAGAAAGLALGLVLGVGASAWLGVGTDAPRDTARPGPTSAPAPEEPGESPGRSASGGKRRGDSRAPEPRRPRGRVERQEPAVRPPPPPDNPPDETKPQKPTADLLAEVEELLRSRTILGGGAADLARVLVARADALPLSFDLVTRALAKSEETGDEAWSVAAVLAAGLSASDAATALRAGLAGDEKLLSIVGFLSDAVTNESADVIAALSVELIVNADAGARNAGVYLSQWADVPPVHALLRVAESDSDGETRAYALSILMQMAIDSEQPQIREVVVPLVLLTALEGPAEARRDAITSFDEIGAAAADTAHALLREGGLDEELAYSVVRPLLDAGRIGDVMTTTLTWEVAHAIVSWIDDAENDEQGAERVESLVPHAQQLIGACHEDAASSLIYAFLANGNLEPVESAALRTDLPIETQRYVLEAMFTTDTAPEVMQGDLEARAVRVFAAYLDPKLSGISRRRLAAQLAEWGSLELESDRAYSGALAVLENAARGDPNSWVRAIAQAAIEELRDSYDDDE